MTVAALAQATALGCLLILLPLWAQTRRQQRARAAVARGGGSPSRTLERARVLGYFLSLGFAFMFVEMACLQKLILVLGNPVYASAAVLGGVLIFAGLGSRLAARWPRRAPSPAMAVLVAAVLAALEMALLPSLVAPLAALPSLVKGIAAVYALAATLAPPARGDAFTIRAIRKPE